jgi:hypothetical protein
MNAVRVRRVTEISQLKRDNHTVGATYQRFAGVSQSPSRVSRSHTLLPRAMSRKRAATQHTSSLKATKDCTPNGHEVVCDMQSICSVPIDKEQGVSTLRAFIFPKGEVVKVPGAPGSYAVKGNFTTVQAPSIVFFNARLERDPQLLLHFIDYEYNSSTMSGISVKTLQLPMKLAANRYSTATRITHIRDVVGFANIPDGTPYTTDLAPTMRANSPFDTIQCSSESEVLHYIAKPMETKLVELEKAGEAKAASARESLIRGGLPTRAEEEHGRAIAHLQFCVKQIREKPCSAYDRRISQRILQLPEPSEGESLATAAGFPWLGSPLAQQIQGKQARLLRSQMQTRHAPADISPPRQTQAQQTQVQQTQEGGSATPQPKGSSSVIEEAPESAQSAARNSAMEISESDDDSSPRHPLIVGERRKRKPTDLYHPPEPDAPKSGKARAAAAAAFAPAPAPAAASNAKNKQKAPAEGINPRTNEAWKRGPYKRKVGTLVNDAGAGASGEGPSSSDSSSALKQKIREQREEIRRLNDKVAAADSRREKELAELELRLRTELGDKMQIQFLRGMQTAQAMSSGTALPPELFSNDK